MAQPKPSPPPASSAGANPAWLSHALVGVCGVCLGIIGTVLILRPQLPRGPAQIMLNEQPGGGVSAAPGLPPPGLTAGLAPAQADRTLGNFHYDQSNWPQAIRYYESAIKQGSDDADIRTDLGNAYRFSGRANDALAEYERAQRMNPQHEFSLFNLGGLYLEELHDRAKAVETWNLYLARFPHGRNVSAARQLIARASAPLSGALPAAPAASGAIAPAAPSTPPPGPDATEARLLQLINQKQAEPKKP
jgi:tetratricopeptide (TPR) repeat protein